jgi:hypothetical protein
MALRALALGRWFFYGLAFSRVGMIAPIGYAFCGPNCLLQLELFQPALQTLRFRQFIVILDRSGAFWRLGRNSGFSDLKSPTSQEQIGEAEQG